VFVLIKSALRALLLPPAGLLLLAAFGLWRLRSRPRQGLWIAGLSLASLWLLSLAIVADPLERLASAYPALAPDARPAADAIVILAGGGVRALAPEYAGPAPRGLLYDRIAYGATLARRTALPILVTGNGAEAYAMRDALARDFAVPARWVDDRARDTYENARRSAEILAGAKLMRILLVTSATHMRRAANEFRAAGFTVLPAPTGGSGSSAATLLAFLPSVDALARSHAALYELAGEPARRLLLALGIR
jgi:uncharacterized SAM-binding protein YcdF (DUF218 family)